MLMAIAYLHNHSVVHRDLKLENWLYETPCPQKTNINLEEAGMTGVRCRDAQDGPASNAGEACKLKLIDFGFSRVFSKGSRMMQSCGSV